MRKVAYVTQSELPSVVARLATADVPVIYIADDRGGTGCFLVVAQAKFLPDLLDIAWDNVPEHEGFPTLGNMPEEDE